MALDIVTRRMINSWPAVFNSIPLFGNSSFVQVALLSGPCWTRGEASRKRHSHRLAVPS